MRIEFFVSSTGQQSCLDKFLNWNDMINLYLPYISDWIQKTQLFPEILTICYFWAHCACPDMPDCAQRKWNNQFVVTSDVWLYVKNQDNQSFLPIDIGNLLFWSTLQHAQRHSWQNPMKMTWWIFSFHEYLTAYKKLTQWLNFPKILQFKEFCYLIG